MVRRGTPLAVLMLLVSLAAAQRLVVFDLEVADVDSGVARTTVLLLRDRLGDAGGFAVVLPQGGAAPVTVDDAVAVARPLGVEKAVVGSIARLGSRFIISYRLIDVAAGAVEFGDRATVSDVAELDVATERIARAIRDRRPFAATGEVGLATEAEKRRTAALSSFYLTTGYTTPLVRVTPHGLPRDPGLMLFTLDAAVSYETPALLVQGLLGLRRGEHSYGEVYFDLLIHRMFGRLDISPYVGGGVGVHRLEMERGGPDDLVNDDGLAVIASAGIVLFRTQYFRIVGGLKGTAVLTEDFGTNVYGSFNFGLTSATVGQGGSLDLPSSCIYGAMGLFFLTGLTLALAL